MNSMKITTNGNELKELQRDICKMCEIVNKLKGIVETHDAKVLNMFYKDIEDKKYSEIVKNKESQNNMIFVNDIESDFDAISKYVDKWFYKIDNFLRCIDQDNRSKLFNYSKKELETVCEGYEYMGYFHGRIYRRVKYAKHIITEFKRYLKINVSLEQFENEADEEIKLLRI